MFISATFLGYLYNMIYIYMLIINLISSFLLFPSCDHSSPSSPTSRSCPCSRPTNIAWASGRSRTPWGSVEDAGMDFLEKKEKIALGWGCLQNRWNKHPYKQWIIFSFNLQEGVLDCYFLSLVWCWEELWFWSLETVQEYVLEQGRRLQHEQNHLLECSLSREEPCERYLWLFDKGEVL